MDLQIADAGGIPRGYSIFSFQGETPQEKQKRMMEQRDWANHQRRLLGMDEIQWGLTAHDFGTTAVWYAQYRDQSVWFSTVWNTIWHIVRYAGLV
jgi:hypothetical protein